MANSSDRIQIPISPDTFTILASKIGKKAFRAVLADLMLHRPYPNHPRPYTLSWIKRITGISSNVSPREYLKAVSSNAGIDITFSPSTSYVEVTDLDLGQWEETATMELTQGGKSAVDAFSGNRYVPRRSPNQMTTGHRRIDRLLHTLNSPSKVFDCIPSIVPGGIDLVNQMRNQGSLSEAGYLGQLGQLRWLELNKRPFYKPVSGTVRLYPDGPGLGLKREVREYLRKEAGWLKADLRTAQLVVVAKRWNIWSLQRILRTEQGFWKYVSEKMGFDDKDLFKDSIYGIIFGASTTRKTKNGIKTKWIEANRIESYDKFVGLQEVHDLIEAVKVRKTEIQQAGWLKDHFGNRHKLDYRSGRDEASLIAAEVQSIEMAMILDVAEVVMNDKRARLCLWLHDGFYFTYSRPTSQLKTLIMRLEASLERWVRKGYWAKVEVEG